MTHVWREGMWSFCLPRENESHHIATLQRYEGAMTTTSTPPRFSHEEQITIAPIQKHAVIRLEATTVSNE